MYNFIPPFIVICIILFISKTRGRGFLPSSFVIYCYGFTLLSSFFIYFISSEYIEVSNEIYFGAFYFSAILFIYLLPFALVRDKKIEKIRVFNTSTIIILSYLVVFFSTISVVYFLSICIKVFTSDKLETFRHLMAQEGHPFIVPGIINTLSSLVAIFYTIPLFLGFISLALELKPRLTNMLFISSLSYPIYVLAYFGRDGILFWLMSFVSIFLFMHPFISDYHNGKVKRFFTVLASIGFLFFFIITISRFGNLNDSIFSIISYLGQQYLNFCIYFDLNITNTDGARTFTILHDFFKGVNSSEVLLNLRWELASQGREYMSWQWGTMFKDLYTDFGSLITFIIVMYFALFTYLCFIGIGSRKNNFIMILFYLIVCQISFQGVFYFKNYTYAGNLYIFFVLMLPFLSPLFKYGNEIKVKSKT